MTDSGLTVLGGGNTAFAVAANLALQGARVTLGELPEFRQAVAPIEHDCSIELVGVAEQGTASLAGVTTDIAAALAENELLLLIIPSYGHRAFAAACASHLRSGQVLVLMPGNLGALEFARLIREQGGPSDLVLAETDTAPYVCRKTAPTQATIWGVASGMGLGVYPAQSTERVRQLVDRWFPGVQTYPHVIACGLSAMNPVVHPAGVLLNAGRIERARGEFYFYDEGVTPSVCRLIEAVDRERRGVGTALELELTPVDEAFHTAGFGPRGDLWSTINGSQMLTALRAPGQVDTRWLSEDVPFGIATWAALGKQYGSDCPLLESLVDVASATLGRDFRQQTRTLADLGIDGLSLEQLLRYLDSGCSD